MFISETFSYITQLETNITNVPKNLGGKFAEHFVSKRGHFHATSLEEHFSSVVFFCCLWKQTASLRRQALESPHKQLKLNGCRRTCDKNVTLHHVRNIYGHIQTSNTMDAQKTEYKDTPLLIWFSKLGVFHTTPNTARMNDASQNPESYSKDRQNA